MARPSVLHDGFLVPNAKDVAQPVMAEPDRIDFNTVANSRWGVIDGCLVTVSGSLASTLGGTVLIDGALVTLNPGSVNVAVGDANDRFDLLVCNDAGTLTLIKGAANPDPVFPDPPANTVLLAAVYARTGNSDFSEAIIDKRKLLSKALLTKINGSEPLVYNLNGSGSLFSISGAGHHRWNGDTEFYKSGPGRLRARTILEVEDSLIVGGAITGANLTVTGKITGSNLTSDDAPPASAGPGDLWQNSTNGRIYVWQNGAWKEMATLESAVPVGAVMTSIQTPSVMRPLGWILLNGDTVSETDVPTLFTISALQPYITGGIAPNRSMTLPDARRRVLMSSDTAMVLSADQPDGFNLVRVRTANMPPHKHNVKVNPGGGFSPQATTLPGGRHGHSTISGGEHGHLVNDPGHAHAGMDFFGYQLQVIGTFWGGKNKIDALFNDRSHTYSVEPMLWTTPAYTGISISTAGSTHGHVISEANDHVHGVSMSPIPDHPHSNTEDTVGNGAPIDITPAYITVFTYVRS